MKIAADDTFKKHLNNYNVIFLNMQGFLSRTQDIADMKSLIENYDFKAKEVFIPNSEISSEFCNAITSAGWDIVA